MRRAEWTSPRLATVETRAARVVLTKSIVVKAPDESTAIHRGIHDLKELFGDLEVTHVVSVEPESEGHWRVTVGGTGPATYAPPALSIRDRSGFF